VKYPLGVLSRTNT